MNSIKYTVVLFVLAILPSMAGKPEPEKVKFAPQKTKPFRVGEEIKYRIHYGLMDAGYATISVKRVAQINGATAYHMVGKGESAGMVDWFFPTKDRYETYMDTHTLQPVKFIRDVDENGYIIKRNVDFNRANNTAKDALLKKDTIFSVPENVQDIFSAFYFARSLDVSNIKKDDVIDIPVFLDHELFPFRIKFVKREQIKTDFGKIWCLKFVPVVQQGRVFEDEDDMHLWISDDANHVPIRIKSELLVGSIKIDLEDYKGLLTPLVFKK